MTCPAFSGPLNGLKALDLSDLSRYKAAITAGQQMGWGYYFPYLLSRNRPDRSAMLIIEDLGSICLFLWQLRDGKPRLDLYFPPTPMNLAVLRRCIERTNEFNGDFSARILRIDEKDAESVGAAKLRVKARKRQYIYVPSTFYDIRGNTFRTLRRRVNYVEKLDNVEVLPFTAAHASACHALLRQWKKEHRDNHGTSGGSVSSKLTIDLATSLPETDLRGEVVLISGRLVAFNFGGEIRPGLACSFERKCDTAVRGLSYFHHRSFLQSLAEFDLVNDGSDAGRAGLRQLKDAFRPVDMHTEFRASQPGASAAAIVDE